jgi:hypothetical protein
MEDRSLECLKFGVLKVKNSKYSRHFRHFRHLICF